MVGSHGHSGRFLANMHYMNYTNELTYARGSTNTLCWYVGIINKTMHYRPWEIKINVG